MSWKKRISLGLIFLVSAWLTLKAIAPPILSNVTFSKVVEDRTGRWLRLTLADDDQYRIFLPLNEISPDYIQAVLQHEDQHFFKHLGVNPWSMVRAVRSTLPGASVRMGGSTITMQLVRLQKKINTRTIPGKLRQILWAVGYEFLYTKNEILEAYFNLLPFGANLQGVEVASQVYFSKSARELTLAEAMTLAVIPQSPHHRSLAKNSSSNIESLQMSRQRLFSRWQNEHPDTVEAAVAIQLPLASRRLKELPFRAPHMVDRVLREKPRTLRLRTTLDLSLQTLLENRVESYVRSKQSHGINNASALLIDSRTSEVLALVGSRSFFDSSIQGQVNGMAAQRSPGSTLKPFVFGLALDQGLIHQSTLLKDTPMSFGAFDPENFDRLFQGPIRADMALVHSRNVPAIFLASLLKEPDTYDFLKNFGVRHLRERERYGLGVALGGAEMKGEDVGRLYVALANGGVVSPLKWTLSEALSAQNQRILSREASFIVLQMLLKNPKPNQDVSAALARDTIPVAWKTGTSHGFRDAWTAGVAGPYVLVVWLGNFGGEPNQSLVGRELAAPLFFQIVDGLKERIRERPAWLDSTGLNVKKISVCSLSGYLPGTACRGTEETWFIPGRSPITDCSIHREISVHPVTGHRLCRRDVLSVKKVFEFWPTDLLEVFRSAGLARRTPPPFEAGCEQKEADSYRGLAPKITSPKRDVVYQIRMGSSQIESIALQAVADADAQQLTWFLGAELIGQTDLRKPLFWSPRAGDFVLRVVDAFGRSDSRRIQVQAIQ